MFGAEISCAIEPKAEGFWRKYLNIETGGNWGTNPCGCPECPPCGDQPAETTARSTTYWEELTTTAGRENTVIYPVR